MPQPTVVMQVEGVLRKPVTGAPLDSGRRLYLGLSQFWRVVLVTEETDHDLISHWLGAEGYVRHDHVVYGDAPVSPLGHWWVNVARMLKNAYGYNAELFVVPDPHDAMHLIRAGHSTLLSTQAAYALPEWHPDHREGLRAWDELVSEVDRGRALRAGDTRMSEKDAL